MKAATASLGAAGLLLAAGAAAQVYPSKPIRVIVPTDLVVTPAPLQAAKALGDSSGAMLEAKFQIRTYVKTAAEGEASGT